MRKATLVGYHVHLFVSAPPEIAPARVVQIMKSITAQKVFDKYPEIESFSNFGVFPINGCSAQQAR